MNVGVNRKKIKQIEKMIMRSGLTLGSKAGQDLKLQREKLNENWQTLLLTLVAISIRLSSISSMEDILGFKRIYIIGR
jgi:hypothetical protein